MYRLLPLYAYAYTWDQRLFASTDYMLISRGYFGENERFETVSRIACDEIMHVSGMLISIAICRYLVTCISESAQEIGCF